MLGEEILRAMPIKDRILSEKILTEMVEDEFSKSLTMALYKLELIELTDRNRYKCVILYGTNFQTDVRRMTILVDANDMNSEILRVVEKLHGYLLNY